MSDDPPSTAAGNTEIGDALRVDHETFEIAHGHVIVSGRDLSGMLPTIDVGRLCTIAGDTLVDEGIRAGRLDLLLVDDVEMADLNERHMGHPGPTDVLAFPLDVDDELPMIDDGPPRLLGDVVICPQVASEQAAAHTGSFDAELALLLVHGVLHVLGHDHVEPAETTVMQDRERHHLARLGHAHPVVR